MKARSPIVMIALLLVVAANLLSAVPQTIVYQGRLTTPTGDPVADGAYLIQLRIYDAAVGGTTLWDNAYRTVPVINGLFTYQLGDSTTLPSAIFEDTSRWLGVRVGSDPEISPRVKLASFAYAFHALRADTAYAIAGDPFVNETGDTMTGSLTFTAGNKRIAEITSYPASGSANLFLHDLNVSATATAALFGSDYGELALLDVNGYATADINAGSVGGWLQLSNPGASRTIGLYSQHPGDAAVAFPDNAINEDELLNEPGLASAYTYDYILASVAALDSIEVTAPTSGYVFLVASGYFFTNHTSGGGDDILRASASTSRNTLDSDDLAIASIESAEPSGDYYFPFSVTCTKAVSAGATKFFLVGDAWSGRGSIRRAHLTALFFPTAYGSVNYSKSPSAASRTPDGSDLPAPEIYDARPLIEAERAAQLEQQRIEAESALNNARRDEDRN